MYQCKSGRHYWLNPEDADKCCNGFSRVLIIGAGANPQITDGVIVGRGWIKTDDLPTLNQLMEHKPSGSEIKQ